MKARMEYFPEKNPNPVLSVETDGTVIYSNKAGEPLLNEWGVKVGEKLPSYIDDLVQTVISRDSPEKMEVKARNRIYLLSFHPLSEDECVNIYGFDISEQRELEGKLRESEEKYRIVADNTFDWEFWLGLDDRFLYMSPSCERVTGYAVWEFMDNPYLLQEIIHPDDRQAFLQHKNDTSPNHHGDIEFRIITKDGEIRWIHHVCQPVYDGKGCYAGNRGNNRDITERKQEEHRIRRYNHILEGINWIFSNVVQAKTEEELGEACLSVALEVTGSEFGFINEIGPDRLLHDVAKSELGWEQCFMYDKTGHRRPLSDFVVHGLYGSVIINEKSFFTNDPQSHPDSIGLPEGHPPLTSFLGVPLVQDGKTIGVIAVANRESGYSFEQQEDLEAIAPAVTQVLQRMRAEQERKQLEEQTRQRAEELETLMSVAPVAIFIGHDPKCQDITGNLMANELYEARSGENVSANTSITRRLFHKGIELTAEELPMQKATFKDIDVCNEEIDVLLPTGEWRGVLGSASPLHDADGNVRGSIGTFIDITERKKAEAKLEETLDNLENLVKERTADLQKTYKSLEKSEKSLAEAQEMAHLGSWEQDFVTNEIYWSDEIYRIFGRIPQEFDATYERFSCFMHPDDQENVNNSVKEALNGKPYSIDHRIILASGEERIVHEQGEVIFNEENIPVRMRGFTQDITERKKAEEKLHRAEEKYRIVAEQTGHLLYDYDLEKGIADWAGDIKEVTGFTPNEFRGLSLLNGWICNIHPDDRKKIQENIEMFLRCGGTYRSEYRFRKKNGEYVYFEDSGICLKDKKGDINRILGVVKDVTERKQAEEFMAKIESARKQELHHRIKNNLQVISSLLDLQADLFKGRKNITDSEVLEAFKQSIDRVISIALIHEELYKGKNVDLLNFSQYIKELANNLLLTYRLQTDVSLNFDLEENIFLTMDTAIPLGIIINEIVSNSFKYAFSGMDKGEIRIKLHREGNGENKSKEFTSAYVLSVSDNGIGIPEDLKIEDLDSLGLQLVTSLVDQLDGELQLKRNNGTEFTIKFNVTEKDNQASMPVSQLQLVDND